MLIINDSLVKPLNLGKVLIINQIYNRSRVVGFIIFFEFSSLYIVVFFLSFHFIVYC